MLFQAAPAIAPRSDPLPGQIAGTEVIVADPGGRASEIDAIRGWAALAVVCFHVFWETFGVAVPWLRNPYTAFLLAGHFDVILFFILSGDALSYPFFHGGDVRYLQRAALKRYPRLTVPIVVVTAVTALAMAAGWVPVAAAGQAIGRPDWLGTFVHFDAKASSALRFAFYAVYAGDLRTNYLPFLWTMPIELLGSLCLLLALFVVPRVRGGAAILFAVAFCLTWGGSALGCFLVGALLGQARAAGLYARLPRAFRRYGAPLGIVLALVAVGYRQGHGLYDLRGHVAAGSVLLFCVYACQPAVRWLSRDRFSQFLGRISYLLYLWHFVVLITLTSGLIVAAAGREGTVSPPSALAIGASTVVVSVIVSWWTLFIEGWARSANAVVLRAVWKD